MSNFYGCSNRKRTLANMWARECANDYARRKRYEKIHGKPSKPEPSTVEYVISFIIVLFFMMIFIS